MSKKERTIKAAADPASSSGTGRKGHGRIESRGAGKGHPIIRSTSDFGSHGGRSDEDLRAIFEQIPIGISIMDRDRKVIFTNPALEKILRLTTTEIMAGKHYTRKYIRPDGSPIPMEEMASSRALTDNETVMNVETGIVTESGEIIWTSTSATPFPGVGKGVIISVVDITEHKRIEDALNASETKYRRLFEASKDGILILDALTGIILDVNPFLIDMLGYSEKQLIGKKVWELGFFKDIAANKSRFKGLQRKGYIRYEDLPLEAANGRQINVEFVSNVYQVDHKTVVQCNIRDITERRKLTEIIQLRMRFMDYAATHSLDELLQKALDEMGLLTQSPLGFLYFVGDDQKTLSLQARSNWSVRKFCDSEGEGLLFTIDKAGIWADCIRERRSVIYNDPAALPKGNGIRPGQAEIVREMLVPTVRGDKVVAIVGLANKPHDYSEQDMKVASYVADITWEIADRMMIQEKIKILSSFPQENPNPVLRVSVDGRIIYANEASAWLLSAWKSGIDEQLPQPYLDSVLDSMRSGTSKMIEISGSGRTFDAVVAPFPGSGYLNIYAVDVTERRRAETALEEAHNHLLQHERLVAIGAIAGGIAHDMRNPLASIKNAIYFLRMAMKDKDPKIIETLAMMEKDILSSDRVIADVLDFARPKTPVREIVKVSDVVEAALARIGVPEGIEVVRYFGEVITFKVDPELMAIALSSLIQNAIQAMPDENGKVKIGCMRIEDPKGLSISISDTGEGIRPEIIGKIFEPLFTTKGQGTGLGLPLAKTLVEMHGGRIDIVSEPGKGSTFTVTIPEVEKR